MKEEPDVRAPDPPTVVMDKFIKVIPSLQSNSDFDKLSQVIITVLDTLFVAPLSQPLNDESTALFRKSADALAGLRVLYEAHDQLLLFTSELESVRHRGVPMYKVILPRLIHAATLAAEREDTGKMGEDLIMTAADVLSALERRAGDKVPYMEGWPLAHRAVRAIKTFVQGALQPHPATLYDYEPLTPSPMAGIICIQITVQAQLSFLDDAISTLGSALSSLGQGAHTLPVYLKAITAVAPYSPTGLEDGVCLALDAHEEVGDLLGALPDDLAATAWYTLYADRTVDMSASKIVFLLSPPNTISPSVSRELLSEGTLLQRWRDSDSAEVRGAVERFILGKPSPRKRKRSDVDDLLRGVADTEGDPFRAMKAALPEKKDDVGRIFPQVVRKLCEGTEVPAIGGSALDIWLTTSPDDLILLAIIARHLDPQHIPLLIKKQILSKLFPKYRLADKRLRVPAIRAIACIVGTACRHPKYEVQAMTLEEVLRDLRQTQRSNQANIKGAVIMLLGALGTAVPEEMTGEILELLLLQLGEGQSVGALASTELLNLARFRKVPITNLFTPHLDRIAALIGSKLLEKGPFIPNVMNFFGTTRSDFLGRPENMSVIVSSLVCAQRRPELELVASVLGCHLGAMLGNNAAWILARAFRIENPQPVLKFLLGCLQTNSYEITIKQFLTTCTVKMVNLLVQDLGDRSEQVQKEAKEALTRASQVHDDKTAAPRDVGTFLQPHILGVITTLNEDLHGARRRMTLEGKRRVIRALRNLIEMMGETLAPTTPQLIASLQSTLSMPGLAEESLVTWCTFMQTLKFPSTGPFIGRTTAAIVANWALFTADERLQAVKIVQEIANNPKAFSTWLNEVVDMSGIPELEKVARQITDRRGQLAFEEQVETLLDRTSSGNPAVATTALREFQALLVSEFKDISRLVRGDSFDLLATKIVRGLMRATQEEDSTVRSLASACLGHLGLLDNDRMAKLPDSGSIVMLDNFRGTEEAADFACAFVRDVLVDSYKITNDIKYQGHLAFAMQELLKFVGFNEAIMDRPGSFPGSIRKRWEQFPQYQIEALSPLLHTRFRIVTTENASRKLESPYYGVSGTYREWVQNWSIMLLQRICEYDTDGAPANAMSIFGVLKGVLRNQDVSVALYVLPHMVLHVLLSGNDDDRRNITHEINAVLKDQVNTTGSADKRALSAQVIFDLMDHLGKWLRLFRAKLEKERQAKQQQNRNVVLPPERQHHHVNIVEAVLNSVETELLANAALQSKAYARSLFNFEKRIIGINEEQRKNPDKSQPEPYAYYERLHEIYADLDEPDGMEGVSMYVMSPSLEYQIREHESTGRWTSAQSCWEVRLQQSPDDLSLHQGLLRCLRNLGHYDTLRTHIRGVLSRRPDWRTELAPFEAEAAWIVGDWDTVKSVADHGYPMAEVMSQLQVGNDVRAIKEALDKARAAAGNAITSTAYSRASEPILSLHILRELEMIYNTSVAAEAERRTTASRTGDNRQAIMNNILTGLQAELADRFHTTAPAFRVREAILSARRTAFGTVPTAALHREIGKAWILSSKMARKAGYEQTAYSAALQAREVNAPYAFIQQAKMTKLHGGVWKAHEELEKSIKPFLSADADTSMKPGEEDKFTAARSLAKAALLEARWATETGRFAPNVLIEKYTKSINLCNGLESPHYHLGHYYDTLLKQCDAIHRPGFNHFTVHNYLLALKFGNKYIFRTMPRSLTIWLDLGELKLSKAEQKAHSYASYLEKIYNNFDKARTQLAPYQFLTAFPQIASRLGHKVVKTRHLLIKILGLVIKTYPRQAIWPMFGLMNSSRKERREQCREVTARTISQAPELQRIINDAERFSSSLLKLADEPIPDKTKELNLDNFDYMRPLFPSQMMLPLQDLLTGTLPSAGQNVNQHNPFPVQPVMIMRLDKRIDVMSSLVKPKKLVFHGSDGKKYPFLCKPKDDLRKDARLMDFNAMINKLLKTSSESRRRQLYIRTYAVMPLNELCGLIEWVSNTLPLKVILEDVYRRRDGKKLYTHDLHKRLEEAKTAGAAKQIATFEQNIITYFLPCAFPDWFLTTWPEPSSWLAARMAYTRTLAVMSMIGHVLGLGDRHCENILFDSLTGDTVHVDLNCLFEKGKTFEIPERVPFRLTQNLVAAMGVTGTEGVFRKASEISMGILRDNAESLMSVLEAFVHDPLVEWTSRKASSDIRGTADKHLTVIRLKLHGKSKDEGEVVSVNNQVETLIQEATAKNNLALMYQGWAPWL